MTTGGLLDGDLHPAVGVELERLGHLGGAELRHQRQRATAWARPAPAATRQRADKLQVVNPCANSQNWGSYAPDPAVGPGAASVATHQIVNFLEFGRCMDVTDGDTSKQYMISYPCKQDPPSGANLYWNHRWFYVEPLTGAVGAPQQISVKKDDGSQYCLKAPTGSTNPHDTYLNAGLSAARYYPTFTSRAAH